MPADDLRKAAGELHQYVIHKKLGEGLRDKSLQSYAYFELEESQRHTVESDCSVCFSADTADNNPLIYCSNAQ